MGPWIKFIPLIIDLVCRLIPKRKPLSAEETIKRRAAELKSKK